MTMTVPSPRPWAAAASASDDIELGKRRPGSDPLIAEAPDIDGPVFAMHDVLGDHLPDCRRLLQPVPGEAIGEIEIAQAGMRPDDRILVEVVIVVMADPGIGHLDRLEGGDPHGEPRPDLLIEPRVIDLEIELRRLVRFLRRQ